MFNLKLFVSLMERLSAIHREIVCILLALAIVGDKWIFLADILRSVNL